MVVDLATETGWIAAGGQTAVTLRLREPITVWDGWTSRGPVHVLHVAADNPQSLEAAIRAQMTTSPGEARLEPWTAALPQLPPLVGDPRMVRYIRGAESPDEIAERYEHFQKHNPRQFTIVDGASDEAIGWMAYWDRQWNDEPVFEIGWAVDARFAGVDLRPAVRQAISAARSTGSFALLLACPSVDNETANAICLEIGFGQLATLDLESPPGDFQRCNVWGFDLRNEA